MGIQDSDQHFVLLGKVGAGKSASGNTILRRKDFKSRKSSKGVTRECTTATGTYGELNVVVHDTPGFCDPDYSAEEIEEKIRQEVLNLPSHGDQVFLLVLKIDRFTTEERNTVRRIERLLGEERLKRTWILFTRGDELEDQTIQDYISESEGLKKVMGKYKERYHVFNNKSGHENQVELLLEKVRPSCSGPPLIPYDDLPERRLILLGKCGVGKSATGNTILGKKYFKSEMSMSSGTQTTQVERAAVNGKDVCVVDTPGLFDTRLSVEELTLEFARSVYECAPGPHAFLIVMPVNNRFTEQEKHMISIYQTLFGPRLADYAIILFTHGDLLEGTTVEQLVKESKDFTKLIKQCGGRYQLFNNKDAGNRVQVKQLMDKIENMIEGSGGSCYSSEMFEAATRAAEEAQREEEERERREAEERERREEEQKESERRRIVIETEERCRSEYEREGAQREAEERKHREAKERKHREAEEREQGEAVHTERKDGGFWKFWSQVKAFLKTIWNSLFGKSDDSDTQRLLERDEDMDPGRYGSFTGVFLESEEHFPNTPP